MNGSNSPKTFQSPKHACDTGQDGSVAASGHHSASPNGEGRGSGSKSSPMRSQADAGPKSPHVRSSGTRSERAHTNGDHNDEDSEAETLIDSPVKKKEANKQKTAVKMERPSKHRIGSLPVPTEGDEETDSAVPSPVPSTVMSVEKATPMETVKDGEDDARRVDADGDMDDNSDSLSSPRSSASKLLSRGSSMSRAVSELPDFSRGSALSPNPRKRKHRASSVSLPNKRPSIEAPKRKPRGLHSEELAERHEKSLSPKLRSHRRAASTQSVFADGTAEIPNRKRRAATQGPMKESKVAKPAWEESDASSETNSYGQPDPKRPQRGVGRSTSTPGRQTGRDHKRHINKFGFTKLAEACEAGDLDMVKEWRERDPDQLELAEFAGNKPLQIAALHGNVEVVDYLIDQGCQIDCANVDKDTPLIDAAENGHVDVVNSLLSAGVDPLRQNLKGQQALDVVTDDIDDADEIRTALRNAIEEWNRNGSRQRREEEEEMRHRAGPSKELHFMARSYENLLKLVQINDRNGVREFLDARVGVDNTIIAAAAKTGDLYLVNMLLAELPEKKAAQKPEKPMLAVLGTSHFDMVKALSELESFNPHYRNRSGETWPELAEKRHGPNWREEKELLQKLYGNKAVARDRRSSSPVSKRDSGKRRLMRRTPEDDSDEDDAPRRKNGRRLMSKRDMRAASGKALSEDESSEESGSEVATTAEESSMKPPESPAKRTTPRRTRNKSFSHAPDKSPGRRRRSSSLRSQSDHILPALEGKVGDPTSANAPAEKRQMEEFRAAEEAEAKGKEAVAAAAAAAAAAETEAAAAAAAKRAEEEARRVEEQGKAEAARRLEEERLAEVARQQEEERKAERARIAEQERIRTEAEAAAASQHRAAVLRALPTTISYALDDDSGLDYNGIGAADYLVEHCTPLQVLKQENRDPYGELETASDAPLWVANVQAAPLLGSSGLELMLSTDVARFEGSLADRWETKSVQAKDRESFVSVVSGLASYAPSPGCVDGNDRPPLSCDDFARRAASSANAAAEAKDRLRNGAPILRYVRLSDVLNHLHPILKDVTIEVRFDHFQPVKRPSKAGGDFFTKLANVIKDKPRPRRYINGHALDTLDPPPMGVTRVTVIHQQ